jgi:cytochrome c peroxidase
LEDQILQPVPNPVEMHETWPNAMSELQADAAYPGLFEAAFGSTHVDSLKVARAIAQFLRTLVSANSPFDKFQRFEGSIPVAAQQGYTLFQMEGGPEGQLIPVAGSTPVVGQGGADCFHCHTPAAGLFTDGQFHNNALDVTFTDLGRADVTNDPYDAGKFKTPTLRNIMLTAPYMHDGRFATIDEVLDHYNDGGHASLTVDPFMKFTDPEATLGLTPEKREQVKAFLNSLTDDEFINDPRFQDPGPPVP